MSTPTVSGAPLPVQRERIFLGTFAYYFFAILLPILLANRYCNDDLIRSIAGNYGWNNNGRHLANLLMRLLQLGGSRTVDIAPLPQLLAIAMLSALAVLLARRFAIRSVLLAILVAIPLGAQPFFLENLAYRFDAATMAAAMLCALWPITSLGYDRKGWWLGTLSLLAAFNLYQPAFNAFLVFASFEVMQARYDGAPPVTPGRLVGFRLLQAVVASAVYKLLFASSMKDWLQAHAALVSTPAEILRNTQSFTAYVVDGLGPRLSIVFGVVVLASLGLVVAACVRPIVSRHARRSGAELLYRLASIALFPVAVWLCLFGPMLLLQEPVFMPRVLVAVGALMSASLIAAHQVLRRWTMSARWEIAAGCVWALAFAVVAAAFGNAAGDQRRYEEAIATQLSDDLAALQAQHAASALALRGAAGYSPMAARVIGEWPILERLIAPYLRENDFNTNAFLQHYLPAPPQPAATPVPVACQATDTVRSSYRLSVSAGVAVASLHPAGTDGCQ